MEIEIRSYEETDRDAWMRTHAVILSISHAWNYSIQERPAYKGHATTRLVAVTEGKIVGLLDAAYENTSGEYCFLRDSLGGYVFEFGRLPEYAGAHLGTRLMEAAAADAAAKGFRRLEYWSQDRTAQRFYRRLGLPEIGRHYRFRMKPPEALASVIDTHYIGVEYLYCACLPEEWPRVREQYEILEDHPLEPHLCVGFEVRW